MIIYPASSGLQQSPSLDEKRSCFSVQARTSQCFTLVSTLLAGILLLSIEVSVLVLFALPVSTLLSVLIIAAMAASVFLLSITICQWVKRHRRADPVETSLSEVSPQVERELDSLRAELLAIQ
ncbi:hypothetical protein [Chlamydia vaughanii]|uniref:hypothetical protein n=1 Tax=Chlamydia vaughanii TaxID=3112552 RepID=UPI0032B10A01